MLGSSLGGPFHSYNKAVKVLPSGEKGTELASRLRHVASLIPLGPQNKFLKFLG